MFRNKRYFPALLSSILLILAFPKFNLSFLAWVSLIPLLLAIENTPPVGGFFQAFRMGIFCGFVFYAGSLYWLAGTLKIYGNIPLVYSILITALLVLYLASFIGLFCGLNTYFNRSFPSFNIYLNACLWVGLEYLRTYLFSGFPWNLLGYSQWNNLVVSQIAVFTGVYGVSFLIVLVNTLIARVTSYISGLTVYRPNPKIIKICVLILVLSLGFGWLSLIRAPRIDSKQLIKTAVLQGNIGLDIKWEPSQQMTVMNKYELLVERLQDKDLKVVFWPETAIPGLLRYDNHLSQQVSQMAKNCDAYFLIGGIDRRQNNFYTACFLVSPKGEILDQYYKTHLVPFGEVMPFRKTLEKFISIIKELGDFTPGEKLNILKTPYGNYGVNICYEDIFPDLVRRQVKNGAQVLINITVDTWYFDTAAPYQHFIVNIFRAIENRRWVARAANTGISGYIDPYGFVIQKTNLFMPEIGIQLIWPEDKLTFYSKYGDVFSWICIGVILGGIIANIYREVKAKCPANWKIN